MREEASYTLITCIKQMEGVDELVMDLYCSVARGEPKKKCQMMKMTSVLPAEPGTHHPIPSFPKTILRYLF